MAVLERLQKTIARVGIASRRHAEQLILSGQVRVNGKVVTELGTKADPERDAIKVGGKLLRFRAAKLYVLLHKPAGCVATMSDPEGRRTLQDCLHGVPSRVYPVGRLEYHASGLVLLTNDGELAGRMLQASRRGLEQTYWLKLKGPLPEEECKAVAQNTKARLRLVESGANPWYEVTVKEARRDLLRQRLAQMGHPVEKLKRVRLANLELGALPAGRYRFLEDKEVKGLERAVARALETGARETSDFSRAGARPRPKLRPAV